MVFTINGKNYSAKPFTVGVVCDLEDMGISLEESSAKPFNLLRGYFMICSGLDKEQATKEIDKHSANGGSLDGLMSAMSKEMNESDFFRSLNQTEEEEETTTPTTRKKKSTIA